jgi:hypothetical protein
MNTCTTHHKGTKDTKLAPGAPAEDVQGRPSIQPPLWLNQAPAEIQLKLPEPQPGSSTSIEH